MVKRTRSEKGSGKPKKAVRLNDLDWKSVAVPDTLDDYEGFYGLEEISGVGVKVENGKVSFEQAAADEDEATDSNDKDQEYVSPFPDEDYDNIPSDSGSESEEEENEEDDDIPESKAEDEMLSGSFDQLPSEDENEEYADNWGLQLSVPIRKALDQLKFFKPTDIQREAIPELMANKDVIGKAATGSGKTLAYGLPIIERHLGLEKLSAKKWPTGLIFAPTRELAHQICKHLKQIAELCAFDGSGIVPVTGGLSIDKQIRQIKKYPAVVVSTPGRFLELLQYNQDIPEMFKKVETLVLDEADRLIQDGHFDEMDKILQILDKGKKRQICVFSATFDRELMNKLTSKKKAKSHNQNITNILKDKLGFRHDPSFIDANPQEAVASKVSETVIECGAMEKDLFLYYFCLAYSARTMVFVNSIDAVKRITPLLKELQLQVFGLHSDMIQKQRLRSLERFKAQPHGILISTDVAARGLDIPLVDHVVHYHVPRSADMYVHRSGRTARAGQEGISVVLCSPDEAAPLKKLQRVIKSQRFEPLDVQYDMVNELKPRLVLAKQITEGITTRTKSNDDWLKQAADDLGADLDELQDDDKRKRNEISKDQLRQLRGELKHVLSKPVGFRSKYVTSGPQNVAQMLVSGKSHEHFMGLKQQTALQSLKSKSKNKSKNKKQA